MPLPLPYPDNYGFYKELANTGHQVIHTDDIDMNNIDTHFNNIIAIMDDCINEPVFKEMKLHVIFPDDELDLYIPQYMYNLMFWTLIVSSGNKIKATDIYFFRDIRQDNIKEYMDDHFVRPYIRDIAIINMNIIMDNCIGKFRYLKNYQMFLANTINLSDTAYFMEKYPEFAETVKFDSTNIPIQDIKEEAMKATKVQIKYIERDDEDHCLKYSFRAGEGVNVKQYKEVFTHIGTKPSGNGSVFKYIINGNFINGGLKTLEDIFVDSSIGRFAQILSHQNVGQSGEFARRLGLNNQDSKLYPDSRYTCDTKNFEELVIENDKTLKMLDMRYYRMMKDGIERRINYTRDKHLIGKKIYLRSPITCASAARGEGVCYRCYGDLAYVNSNVNIGQTAADTLSSRYTQKLLSAKHLLESSIIKINWSKEFYDLFNVEYDQIMLRDDMDYHKFTLIINSDDINDNETDEEVDEDYTPDMQEANYIFSFKVQYPDGHIVDIKTKEEDPIYITNEFAQLIENDGESDDGTYSFSMSALAEKNMSLFTVEIRNNELAKTMKQIKSLIDSKGSISTRNRNTILSDFIKYSIEGGIIVNSSHLEIIIMNQMRAYDDILERPDWTVTDAPYQIIRLDESLTNNMSISVRLQSSKLKKTFINHANRKLHKPSNMDIYGMVQPQNFMNRDILDTKANSENVEKKPKKVLFFDTSDNPDTGLRD